MWDLKKVGDGLYRAVVRRGFMVADIRKRKVVDEFRHPALNELTAICDLPDGGFLACVSPGGYGKTNDIEVVEFDGDGSIKSVWKAEQEPGRRNFFYAQPQELPNGHVYICNWTGHGELDSKRGWQVLEFDSRGKVVWHLDDWERFGSLSGIDVLQTP